MSLQGALRTARVHLLGHHRRRLPAEFWEPLRDARALEVGGPTADFGAGGLLPAYTVLKALDGVQPVARTAWHDLDPEAGYVVDGRRMGALHLIDGVDLDGLRDGAYDAVLSAHVLEHIANPLKALSSWRRVTVPGGLLLLVVPHMAGTFDHRRPLTALRHMVADYELDTSEDDLTHVEEFLALHDGERDIRGLDDPTFVADIRDNPQTRLLHHHTFTTTSLIELLTVAGVQLRAVETRLPHDIRVLGRWTRAGERPENRGFYVAARRSPFRVDRRAARQIAGEGTPTASHLDGARQAPPPAGARS